MPLEPPGGETPPPRSRRYGYFVLQASWSRTAGTEGGEVTGVLEDLTTGVKQPFGSIAEITRLMEAWAANSQGKRTSDQNSREGM